MRWLSKPTTRTMYSSGLRALKRGVPPCICAIGSPGGRLGWSPAMGTFSGRMLTSPCLSSQEGHRVLLSQVQANLAASRAAPCLPQAPPSLALQQDCKTPRPCTAICPICVPSTQLV